MLKHMLLKYQIEYAVLIVRLSKNKKTKKKQTKTVAVVTWTVR